MRCSGCGRELGTDYFCPICNEPYSAASIDRPAFKYSNSNLRLRIFMFSIMAILITCFGTSIAYIFASRMLSKQRIDIYNFIDWEIFSLLITLALMSFSYKQLGESIKKFKDAKTRRDTISYSSNDTLKNFKRDKL